jgi:hypothetical protein
MNSSVEIEKLSPGSVFKLVCLGTTFAVAPLCALGALLALFGVAPASVSGVAYTGIGGFFVGLLFAPFLGLSFGLSAVVFVPFGWWIYGQFRPRSLTGTLKSQPSES